MLPHNITIVGTLIILLILATVSARLDAGVWKRKGISKAGHIKRALFRGLFIGIQAHSVFPLNLDIVAFSLFWLVQSSVWWLVFDMLINLFKGKELFYVGRTAFLDRIFWILSDTHKGAAITQLIVKFMFLITSAIYLYLY